MTVTLGAAVKDILTGFEGIVVGRIDYLFSGRTYLVQSQTLGPDGRPIPAVEFVSERLRVIRRDALHHDMIALLGTGNE